MIPTPRTDACTFHLALCNNDLPTDAVVPAEKMKELEIENVEMRKALTELGESAHGYLYAGPLAGSWRKRLDTALQAARSALEPAQPPAQKH